MLGRKQSLRGELELLPYEGAQEETNNESVGVDWMNKVNPITRFSLLKKSPNEELISLSMFPWFLFFLLTSAMDETAIADERFALPLFRFSKHTQDLRAISIFTPCYICLRFVYRTALYRRNGGKDSYA